MISYINCPYQCLEKCILLRSDILSATKLRLLNEDKNKMYFV